MVGGEELVNCVESGKVRLLGASARQVENPMPQTVPPDDEVTLALRRKKPSYPSLKVPEQGKPGFRSISIHGMDEAESLRKDLNPRRKGKQKV